jgi:hypothetical protein
MGLLNPTPADRLCGARGRPYFLWDVDIDLARFAELIRSDDESARACFIAKLMPQAAAQAWRVLAVLFGCWFRRLREKEDLFRRRSTRERLFQLTRPDLLTGKRLRSRRARPPDAAAQAFSNRGRLGFAYR